MNRLIIFNKPYGVICQFGAHEKHQSLKDYIDCPGFYPAGRLDADSEGLLLLTNDGRLQARIADPKFKLEKTYWAQLEGAPDEAKLDLLRRPMDLGGFIARPARIRLLAEEESARLWPRHPPVRERKTVPDFWLEIKIGEGKNRQVRRMTAKAGYPCLRLVRVAAGGLNILDCGLPPGEWRFTA
ncbi:MAG: pseudouridine synthase, partial [Neisseria sp.]|nr:pseudouridine synthase [Neisseria sp.]